jgi:hypothetical protein
MFKGKGLKPGAFLSAMGQGESTWLHRSTATARFPPVLFRSVVEDISTADLSWYTASTELTAPSLSPEAFLSVSTIVASSASFNLSSTAV